MRAPAIGLALWTLGLGGVVGLAQPPDAHTWASGQGESRNGQPATPADAPVILRQPNFNLPFTVNPAAGMPSEVHLYVSTDRGASWRFYDRAVPTAGGFAFRAPRDGEYWFALQTVEADGRAAPRLQNLRPGRRVVVDTVEPQLQFDAAVGPAGDVTLSWKVADSTLAPETFKIEYQPAVDGPWQPVPIDAQPSRAGSSLAGQKTWRPETPSRVIHVRAEVADRANNVAVQNRRVFLPKTSPRQQQAATVGNAPASQPMGPGAASEGAIPWPADTLAPTERPPAAATAAADPARATRDAGTLPHQQGPEAGRPAVPAANPLATSGLADTTGATPHHFAGLQQYRYPPVESEIQPPVGKEVSAPPKQEPGAARPPANVSPYGLPPGERPRMTSAAALSLEYEIESVGPAGVAEVQLWGTADRGQTWTLWKTDPDKQSPLELDAPREGIFGFRIVVVGNNGLAGSSPHSGDPADLWVGVDTTKPSVRLTSAIYGEGQHAGNLDIRWQAEDAWLAERPVSLFFSEEPNGPWSTIASGLPNSGQYYWPVESRIPEKIYLRIEVVDEAGNRGEHQLTEPISTTGLIPQARIRGLRQAAP